MYRLLLPFVIACGSVEAAPAPTSKPQPASTGTDQQACVESFARSRSCTDQYIPALVDTRAKYDSPAGIGLEVKADRTAVIERAKAEWTNDSRDDAIANTCQRMMAAPDAHADAETARGCLAEADCGAYVTCVMAIFEKHLRK